MSQNTTPSDLYMNFLDASVTLGADSSVLAQSEVSTGLSIRGQLAFLIHLVQFQPVAIGQGVTADLACCVSTRADLTTMPDLGANGTIDKWFMDLDHAALGTDRMIGPWNHNFLPPIPVAAPKIVTYAKASVNNAVFQNKKINVRIGYTTVKIDSKLYTELAETWGFSN